LDYFGSPDKVRGKGYPKYQRHTVECHKRFLSLQLSKLLQDETDRIFKTFPDEASCEEYLKNHRGKVGVVCKHCGGHQQIWDKYNKCWICKKCGHKTTLKADTVMHNSKLSLMYWFTAIHLLTSTRKTFSALEMQRQLGHKRYQPIWEMMHKLRSVMGQRDTTYQLSESLELDEAFFSTENSSV
jgi:ribosomal protein L37AE/L43A